jgi:septal ring factor EnvC (AmiA/AmiB activator)
MFSEATQLLVFQFAGVFLVGWMLGKLSSRLSARQPDKRDPRDRRILSLEADHRVAKLDATEVRGELSKLQSDLEEEKSKRQERDQSLQKQSDIVNTLRHELKESVIKTRELRTELTDRAEQGVKSEVKLREVETELSVAHASTDLIATGVLDYSLAPDAENEPDINKSEAAEKQ